MTLIYTDTLARFSDLGVFAPGRVATVAQNGKTYVVAGADGGTGIGLFELKSNGALSLLSVFGADMSDGYQIQGAALEAAYFGGEAYVFALADGHDASGNFEGVTGLRITANETLEWVSNVRFSSFSGAEAAAQNGFDPAFIADAQGNRYLISFAGYGMTYVFSVDQNGALTQTDSFYRYSGGNIDTLRYKGNLWVAQTGPYNGDQLTISRIDTAGKLVQTEALVAEPLIWNDILNDVKMEVIGGRAYVFLSENTTGSISVFHLKGDGSLEWADFESRQFGGKIGYPYSLETFTANGQTYLAAGGNGTGFGVYLVSDNGALSLVDEVAIASGLRTVSELAVAEVGGTPYIIATAPTDYSIRSYRFVSNHVDQTGGTGADRITASDMGDRLYGKAGRDTIKGGDGRDLIEGGSGSDRILAGLDADNVHGDSGMIKSMDRTGMTGCSATPARTQ